MERVKAWIQAFRLRTLPLAFSCILMGGFIAASEGKFDAWILILSLMTTLFLQILSNLANDFGDAESGVDGAMRSGPGRTVSAGLITRGDMKNGMISFAMLSLISGGLLIFLSFGDQWDTALVFLMLGLTSIGAAITYTVGKRPYGYAGWGDLFVLIFFGVVGVGGSYYLYTQELNLLVLLPSLSCGLFAVGVLNVNNIRDIESDKAAGKYSIPVRIGRRSAIIYHWSLLGLGLICAGIYVYLDRAPWQAYLFLLTIPLFISNAKAVKNKTRAGDLDPYLRQLAITTLLFVILFGIGQTVF